MNRRQLLQALPALAAGQSNRPPNPKSHLRAGLVAYSFRKQLEEKSLTYENLIRYVADLGLDGLDTTVYWFRDNSDQFLASLRQTAYRNGIELYSIAVRARLCQSTSELQQAEAERIRGWVDVAVKLGAGHVRVFGGSIPKGATESEGIPLAVETLKRAAGYAGSKGILLGIEDDGGLTTTAEPTVEIVKRADSPWVGINLDTGNFPKDGYSQVQLCIPYALNVHFKANIAGPDGTKEPADWDRLLAMFAQGGYRGFVSLEYEDQEPAETAVPRLSSELRRLVRKYSA